MKRLIVVALVVGCGREAARAPTAEEPAAEGYARKASLPRPARAQGLSGLRGDVSDEALAGNGMAATGSVAGNAYGGIVEKAPLVSRRARASPPPQEPAAEEVPPTRAWFPETFLFAPLVVTDRGGAATVSVRVPDRLTTWRVLALAHSRAGAQAGAETSFLGTLPAYVDPVVPSFLMVGDDVRLPVQVVNTTDESLALPLAIEVEGAAPVKVGGTVLKVGGTIRLGPQGRSVSYVPVRASKAGRVTLRASLGRHDAVERSFPVLPTGRPLIETRRGTLAAARSLEVVLPAGIDGASARLVVFPGPLALLRAELAGAAARSEPAGDAYALLLAGRGEALLRTLGGEPASKELRALGVVAAQRVIRATRSPDPLTAALYTEAALAHPNNPVLSRLGERLADTVAAGQRPDGTFVGTSGWTLQRLLVVSAQCLRAVRAASQSGAAAGRQRAVRVSLRARAAFERNIDRVDDAYTAAAILAAGVLEGAPRERLRKKVREELRQADDGARSLPVARGVVRADGLPPSIPEATALALLALRDDPASAALISDVGASLLSSYDPERGFGDGQTNLLALAAVLSLFRDPLPPSVTVTLAQDGRALAERVLEGPKLREALAFEAPLATAAGRHVYEIRAQPPVAGLAYALALKGFVPWPRDPPKGGLELTVESPKEARVGRPVEIGLRAAAPAGLDITIRHALPAGVQADIASLDALVSAGTIQRYRREDGVVVFDVAARAAGQLFSARYRAIPTMAGTLTSGASVIRVSAGAHEVPPIRWVVR
jgi:hypothetical protein